MLRDASAAVDAAHRHQLIHRDLKPENIFLMRSAFARGFDGSGIDATVTAKVLDFGLAKYMVPGESETPTTQQTNPGVLLGTLVYMAPEQLRGGDPAPQWDLWALAVVTYEMVTGRHPFAGTPIGVLSGGADGYHDLITAPLADAAPGCREFFVQALAIDPATRPKSAHELFAEFQRTMV